MGRVFGVSFARHGRLALLDGTDVDARPGDPVLIDTGSGPEVARVACVADGAASGLPRCAGRAAEADLERDAESRARRAEILAVARHLIARHGLPMTVLAVDHIDRSPVADRIAVIYFRAPHRVDFRALLPDLARGLQARIDLRQVGERDAAALLGGVGPCGRELCCALVGPATKPVRAPRGAEADGVCGRVQCCAAYEDTGRTGLTRRRRPGA